MNYPMKLTDKFYCRTVLCLTMAFHSNATTATTSLSSLEESVTQTSPRSSSKKTKY